jgi:predicted nucleic acid-binding protein
MLMKTNILLDTNVLVYAYDVASPFHSRAVALLTNTMYELHTTTKNVSEFFAVLSKQNQTFVQVWTFYQDLKLNAQILFPNPATLFEFEQLIQKYQPRGNKVFDLEIAAIGLGHNINTIATVNISDFSTFTEVTVLAI